jgi:F-type H+-transporting ATPase subunit b
MPFLTAIVVFLAAFFILKAKVWPRITAGLDERDRKISDEIAAAEEARRGAEASQKEFAESLAGARREASEMIAKARADAKAAAEEMRSRNEAELASMKQRASRDIEAAKLAAMSDLHAQATNLAAAIAGKILAREITAADQDRLVNESLQQLAGAREE